MTDKDKIVYCGLGTFLNKDTGAVLEKAPDGTLKEAESRESAAEKRFVDRNLKKQKGEKVYD